MIQGDDLAGAVVQLGPELARPNASVLHRATITGFLQMDANQRRSALAPIAQSAGSAASVLLTIPSSWCAMHPIAVTCSQWDSARAEIVRSIDRMLPLSPENAEVGLVDLVSASAGPSDQATGGMLIGADRTRVEPWSTAITEAMGMSVDGVLCPVIAAIGLGLQHEENSAVVEPDGSAHLLRWGRLTAIDANAPDGAATTTLTDDDAEDLAVAAALAGVVAPGAFRPITGAAPKQPKRWLAPAACAALALGLLYGASVMSANRYEAGIEAERQQQQAMADDLAETQSLRLETERLTRLLNDGVAATVVDWRALTPALIEAQASIPADGSLHRLDLDRQSVSLRGETRDAGAALGALEASAAFTGAAFTAPVSKTPDGSDVFELRADRPASRGAGE